MKKRSTEIIGMIFILVAILLLVYLVIWRWWMLPIIGLDATILRKVWLFIRIPLTLAITGFLLITGWLLVIFHKLDDSDEYR